MDKETAKFCLWIGIPLGLLIIFSGADGTFFIGLTIILVAIKFYVEADDYEDFH